jgi:uncharacterized protein YutE (UPF0331/DUF86 family)
MIAETKKEYSGTWWVSDHENSKIQGTLTFDPKDGLRLEASDSFDRLESDSKESVIPCIFGRTDQGEEVTLQECTQTKGEVRVEEGSRTTSAEYRCRRALIGGHFSDESVNFEQVRVEIPWLTEWVGVSGMDISGALVSDEETENGVTDDFVLRYNFPELPPISVDDLSFQFRSNTSFEIDWSGKALIEEEMTLHINSIDGSRTLASYLKSIDAFCALLSLGIRKQVNPTRIVGITNLNAENESRIEALSPAITLIDDDDTLERDQIVFRYQDLEPKIEQVFQSWFRKYDDLEPVLDLYFSAVHENKSYYRDRIITLLSALEAYHQARYAEQYVTTEDIESYFAERSNEDVIQFSKESIAELESKLEAAEYPSLSYRLTELIDETVPVNQVLPEDYETHIDKLITVRNELVHGSDVDLSDSEAAMVQALPALIMDGLLLTEVGLTSDQIQKYLRRSYLNLTNPP